MKRIIRRWYFQGKVTINTPTTKRYLFGLFVRREDSVQVLPLLQDIPEEWIPEDIKQRAEKELSDPTKWLINSVHIPYVTNSGQLIDILGEVDFVVLPEGKHTGALT